MTVSLIVAMAENRVIGRDNDLPWRLSDDLKRFKRLTLDHSIVMGRRTWESIGRPLPRRHSIVLTRQADFQAEGATVVHDVEEALAAARGEELFICGGAAVYAAFLPRADRLYLTRVQATVEGDTHFPDFDDESWKVVHEEAHGADDKHDFPFVWQDLIRA